MTTKDTHGSGVPIQPSAKGARAEPQVNSDVEMGSVGKDQGADGAPSLDIMQVARIGDIAAMEKILESKELDATYCDEEGITALHVCLRVCPLWILSSDMGTSSHIS